MLQIAGGGGGAEEVGLAREAEGWTEGYAAVVRRVGVIWREEVGDDKCICRHLAMVDWGTL